MSEKPTMAAVIALIGGILSLIIDLAITVLAFIPTLPSYIQTFFVSAGVFFLAMAMLGLIGSIFMFSTDPGKIRIGSILALISGILNLLPTIIGGILLIIGGALGLSWKPPEETIPVIQPVPVSVPTPQVAPQTSAAPTVAMPTKTSVHTQTSVKGAGTFSSGTQTLMARFVDSQGRLIPITSPDKVYGRKDFSFLPSNIRRFISNKHFRLFFRGGKWYIMDLNSTNGTYVNGEDIRGKGIVELSDGDKVNLSGVVELTFHI